MSKSTGPKIDRALRTLYLRLADNIITWIRAPNNPKDVHKLDLPSRSIKENKRMWNQYDWSIGGGEEWTDQVRTYRGINPIEWKATLVQEMMLKYIKKDSTILEIGPGAGRWTGILQKMANRLILVDISEKPLALCRERFRGVNNIEYYLLARRMDFIDDDAIDFIWSYDVFVHINPTDTENYIADFRRTLRRGGYAIIHHADKYSDEKLARHKAYRSHMNAQIFAEMVRNYRLELVEQNSDLVHFPGDIISVFRKPVN